MGDAGCASVTCHRRRFNFPCLAATALLVLRLGDAGAQMTGLNPTPAEISQLPKFCWGQMAVPNAVGDQYKPTNCGPGTNHYCPGLVKLLRAKREVDGRKKRSMVESAASDVRYTEGYIASFPACSIRPHVEATKVEVGLLLRLLPPASRPAKP